MRVMSIQHYPAFGGPYNEILQLEPYLNAAGVQTVVAMSDEAGTAFPRIRGQVPIRRIRLGRARLSRDPRMHWRTAVGTRSDIQRLAHVMDEEAVDLVKVHGAHNPQGAVAARLAGKPAVWVISSTRTPAAWRRLGMALVDNLASSLLVQGNGASLLEAYPGGRRLQRRAIGYFSPVDGHRFRPLSAPERQSVRRELDVPEDGPLIGTIANINPMKGIEAFVAAAERIAERHSTAHFVVAGAVHPGHLAYFERVRSAAMRAGLYPQRLKFLGERADVARVVGAFDVKAVTSVAASEGTTTTIPEAMSCGVPVVATDVGVVRDVLENGGTGLVVPPGAPAAVADAVLELLRDDRRRSSLGEAARRTALERFSPERSARAHVEAYELALASGPRRTFGRRRAGDPKPATQTDGHARPTGSVGRLSRISR